MTLYSVAHGAGESLIILHGLFGSSDNWQTLAKRFAEEYRVLTPDARNHGRSPHSDVFDFPAMADDVAELMDQQHLRSAFVIGHSMGGKTGMQLAASAPDRVEKLVVVDIAPRAYPPLHDEILDALLSVDPRSFTSRADADRALAEKVRSADTRQFLLKNLARLDEGGYKWKMNLEVISEKYEEVSREILLPQQFAKPVLFLKGKRSSYVRKEDEGEIRQKFPKARIEDLDAGHWVHAEAPEEFYTVVMDFFRNG